MPEQKGINLNVPPNVSPIHADEVMIHRRLKVKKAGDGFTKVGHLRVWFIDSLTNKIVADIQIDRSLAEPLSELFKRETDKLVKELESKQPPEKPKGPAKVSSEETRYIG
jgi:hypothetical protein